MPRPTNLHPSTCTCARCTSQPYQHRALGARAVTPAGRIPTVDVEFDEGGPSVLRRRRISVATRGGSRGRWATRAARPVNLNRPPYDWDELTVDTRLFLGQVEAAGEASGVVPDSPVHGVVREREWSEEVSEEFDTPPRVPAAGLHSTVSHVALTFICLR